MPARFAARTPSLELGHVRVGDSVVGIIHTESPGFPWEGVLGAGFLRRFTATFDYSRLQLWLTPNAAFAEQQLFDASGVGFERNAGGRHMVEVVMPDSPASESLREGDMLISIDGQDADGLMPRQIVDILSRPRQLCVLKILRGDEVRTVTLRLRQRL